MGASDTPDAAQGSSDSGGASGLMVEWSSQPGAIPGDVDGNITITSAKFRIDNLRVIGDAGDTETTKNDFTIVWKDGAEPETIEFANAPTGVYSRVAIQADGHLVDHSWEIQGTVKLDSGTYDFDLEDHNALNISLPMDKMLQPGKSLDLKLRVEFSSALQSIDYDTLDKDGDTLELDTDDDQMPAFRAKLLENIKLDASTSG